MKNTAFFGLPVFLLVIGFAVTGCETPTSEVPDQWTDVTALNQADGTWKGSYRETTSDEGLTVTNDFENTITINADEKTLSETIKVTTTFSGEGIDDLWDDIKAAIRQRVKGVSIPVYFNDKDHSITMTEAGTIPIEDSDMAGVQINQYGTKLKILMEDIDSEMILTKQ
ncbi:MAG: hypothetical protein LBU28_01870 [Spirochaetaceae bacterium]|jgi:hypothetical protein|nr:hypothetical protein [Spirochaetaceae bacterium]